MGTHDRRPTHLGCRFSALFMVEIFNDRQYRKSNTLPYYLSWIFGGNAMNTPISCEFYDQLMVAIQRKIPSTIVYWEDAQKKTLKSIVSEITMIDYEEFLVVPGGKAINLQTIFLFNGKKHKEE